MQQLLSDNSLILMEGAIVESLRRSSEVELHPLLVNAPLIYEEAGRQALTKLYQNYIDIALEAETPFLMCTPTWRANKERVSETGINPDVNIDAARFLQDIRESQKQGRNNIKIGGLIGCKNDCYLPHEALSARQAEQFHTWQIEQLKQGEVDFIIAETLPCIDEAIGIAKALGNSGLPYFISFVISRDGRVLDGTDLCTAIKTIDANTDRRPLGFMVNCAYPTFLNAATQPPELFKRLIGYLANASSRDHCDLDGSESLLMESVPDWGEMMLELNRVYSVKVLGGCCGTNEQHLQYIVDG
ncbi:MAG: homocysteine S-methyltransferase family protein [Xanthomonadales bacterium]|nr:homocysteine S-methyltransferase family protein [Xanthomonadales bacterium]MDH4021017.1 homocysteine S-methyltransferase family protein [Xanthomonadales bacterium]